MKHNQALPNDTCILKRKIKDLHNSIIVEWEITMYLYNKYDTLVDLIHFDVINLN